MINLSDLALDLKPFILRWISGDATSGAQGVIFDPSQYPEALLRDGSRSLLGNLTVGTGVTIDGIDIDVANASILAWQAGHLAAADPHPQYALEAIQILAGTGMTGGGTLAADRTLSVNTAFAFTWGARHTFAAGLTSNANINGTVSFTPGRRDWSADGVGYGGAAIYNDGSLTYNRLMIVGSDAANPGFSRRIGLWDDVDVARLIGSQTFASGFAGNGWRIDQGVTVASQTTAEFDNLTVRGLMRVYELLIHKIRTGNGSYLFAPGGKVKNVTGSGPYTIEFETDHGLAANDLARAQKFDLGFAGVYQSNITVTSIVNTTTLVATLFSGVAPAAGYEYARLGNTSDTNRRGGVYITSDDVGAPYIDVYDGVAAFTDWGNASLLRARLGRLSGITDALFGTLSGYGLYTTQGYFTGGIRATSGRIDGVLDIGVNGGIWQGSSGTFAVPGTGMRMLNSGGNGYLQFFSAGVASGLATITLGPNGATFLAPSGYGIAGYPVVQFEAGFDGVVGTLAGAFSSNIRALTVQAGGGTFGASLLTLIANSNTSYAMMRMRGVQQTAHILVNGGLLVGTTTDDGSTPAQRLHVNGGVRANAWLPAYTGWATHGAGDGGAAIYNDASTYQALMIVGNVTAGGSRRVQIWDELFVNDAGGGGLFLALARVGEAWAALSYNTGWSGIAGYHGASYKRVGDLVFLRGTVQRTSGTEVVIATLPSGYRPTQRLVFPRIGGGDAIARVDIRTNGNVEVIAGDTTYIALDGIVFSTLA